MGCGVKFDQMRDEDAAKQMVPVFFTRNGKEVIWAKVRSEMGRDLLTIRRNIKVLVVLATLWKVFKPTSLLSTILCDKAVQSTICDCASPMARTTSSSL